jgi:parvulin-like peptidyl-prolyl isomerase
MRPNFPGSMMPPPPPSQAEPSAAQMKPGPTVTMPAVLKVSGVAAIVNGQKITNQDLVAHFLQNGGQPLLQELITFTEIQQAAAKAHVVVTPAEIDQRLAETKKQVLTRYYGQTWAQFLESRGLSEAYAREQTEIEIILDKLAVAKLPPFSLKGEIHVYHILLATTNVPYGSTPHKDDDAIAQLKQIKADIVAGKITFQDAAKKYSEDHSNSAKGGDLGWISQTDPYDPAFKTAAFGLKQGQISDPVKSQFGYHLIYVAETGDNATPAEVQKASQDTLRQRAGPMVGQLVQQIQAQASVEDILIPAPPKPKAPTPISFPRQSPVVAPQKAPVSMTPAPPAASAQPGTVTGSAKPNGNMPPPPPM